MKTPQQEPPSREERLAQALRANIARRKAQARARAEEDAPEPTTELTQDAQKDKET